MFRFGVLALAFVGLQISWTSCALAQTEAPASEAATDSVKEAATEPAKETATAPAPVKKAEPRELAADPSGTWKWDYTFNDNKAEFKLKLDWDGKQLKGKYTAFNNTTEIEDAKLEKDQLTFVARREFNGQKFDVDFEGQLKDDEIVGTVTVALGDEPREFEWNAKRAVEVDDVVGEWNLRLETPNGVVEPKLTIKKGEKDALSGTYESVFGEREPKNLALKDNQLTWEISSDDQDEFDFKVVYKGRPRGNLIEGTNEFDFGGNAGTMKFTGKRTPPEEKKKEPRPAEAKPAETPAATETKPAAGGAPTKTDASDESKD